MGPATECVQLAFSSLLTRLDTVHTGPKAIRSDASSPDTRQILSLTLAFFPLLQLHPAANYVMTI